MEMSETKRTMAVERSNGNFDPQLLSHVMYIDESYFNKLKDAYGLLEREIVGMKLRPFEMSEEENRKATMAQMRRLIEMKREMGGEAFEVVRHALLMYDRATSMRLYVHETLFCETIRTQGTREQVEEWLPKAESGEVFGCFGMTELCHSSYLRGLKTKAVFEAEEEGGVEGNGNGENGSRRRGSYVLNSEGIGATKWWIGGAGQTATHGVILTQLEGAGTVWMIVPLRDRMSGEAMPGVEIGHLGPKSGRDGLDSGWIRFTNARVPSSHLLSRFLSLQPNGTYIATPNTQHLAYNTLIGERLQALSEAAAAAAQAAVIATRYALVRRQGPRDPQIIDFKVQYTSLMPQLATSVVVTCLHASLFPLWQSLVLSGSTSSPSIVSDWHATAASLKSLWTWWCLDSIETSRRSLGGHAFSSFNAVTGIWRDVGVLTTGGGDNYVLAQQCAQYLIKSYMAFISPSHSSPKKHIPLNTTQTSSITHASSSANNESQNHSNSKKHTNQSFSATGDHSTSLTSKDQTSSSSSYRLNSISYLASSSRLKTFGMDWPLETTQCHDCSLPLKRSLIEQLLLALRATIVFLLDSLLLAFSKRQDWNEYMNDLIALSNLHGMQLTLDVMLEKLEGAKTKIQPILADLILLHSLHHCTSSFSSIMMEHSVLTPIQFSQLKRQSHGLAKSIRSNAALLCDSFAFPDYVIKAPLGRYDGDIYQPYFNMVKAANHEKITPYWISQIKPLFSSSTGLAKL
jgi:acyl-CoA oxidase